MNHNPPSTLQHGFRISIWDMLILVLGFGLTWWVHSIDFPLWWGVPMALGHFFLFCNVFLVWIKLELLWAAVLVANVGVHVAVGDLGWWPACGWQLPVTIFVILLQWRSPWYHGIFARRINPCLDDYLGGKL